MSSARLKGIEQDLNLTGQLSLLLLSTVHIVYISTDIQYETVLAVLYASYVPAQIPSNMILNRISRYVILPGNLQPTHSPHRPSLYIPACICIWGMTSALTGVRSSKYLIDTVLIINS